jgi:hypothetical protein
MELAAFVAPGDRSELSSWIGFQRAYRMYRLQAGATFTGGLAHDWACNHGREYAPDLNPEKED